MASLNLNKLKRTQTLIKTTLVCDTSLRVDAINSEVQHPLLKTFGGLPCTTYNVKELTVSKKLQHLAFQMTLHPFPHLPSCPNSSLTTKKSGLKTSVTY